MCSNARGPIGRSRLGRAAHFAHRHDQRFVQQTAIVQIGQQRRECLVERGDQMVLQIVAAAVRIPTVAVDAVVMDGDKPHARFDQPPRHQAGLPVQMPAVAVAQRGRFLSNVQSGPRFF